MSGWGEKLSGQCTLLVLEQPCEVRCDPQVIFVTMWASGALGLHVPNVCSLVSGILRVSPPQWNATTTMSIEIHSVKSIPFAKHHSSKSLP